MNKSVKEIAERIGGSVIGNEETRITGVSGLNEAASGDLTFVRNARYRPLLESTKASAALVGPDIADAPVTLIQVSAPELAFAQILGDCSEEASHHPVGIHDTAVIGSNVKVGEKVALGAHVVLTEGCEIGDGAILYAGVYVGHDAIIGANTIVYPNVTILDRVTVGSRCILHSGAVLGADGFGFAPINGVWMKIPQVGTVILGDEVEVGANTAIDRATFGTTMIACGTKIDNLVQIGHNVRIGEHSAIAGTAAIAGSAVIGKHVMIGARAGIAGHLDVGDGAQIGAYSGVTKTVEPGCVVSGFPATDHKKDLRNQASQRKLPEALRRLRKLEQRIQELEEQLDGKAVDNS